MKRKFLYISSPEHEEIKIGSMFHQIQFYMLNENNLKIQIKCTVWIRLSSKFLNIHYWIFNSHKNPPSKILYYLRVRDEVSKKLISCFWNTCIETDTDYNSINIKVRNYQSSKQTCTNSLEVQSNISNHSRAISIGNSGVLHIVSLFHFFLNNKVCLLIRCQRFPNFMLTAEAVNLH